MTAHKTYHGEDFIAQRHAIAAEASKRYPALTGLLDAVCCESGVPWTDVCSFVRTPQVIACRRAFAALARELPVRFIGNLRPSFPEIASVIGTVHSTAITGYRHVYADPLAKKYVDGACNRLGVPPEERPAWLTLAPIEMRRAAMQPAKDDDA